MGDQRAPNRSIVAEFHKKPGRPLELFSLTVTEPQQTRDGNPILSQTVYDVDHSQKYGYLFHQSGWGGADKVQVSGIYYVRGAAKIKETPTMLVDPSDKPPWRGKGTRAIRRLNRTRRLRAVPFSLDGCADLLEWLQRHGIEQEAVYCSECNDNMLSDELCDHCWWCDKIGWYSTPSDRCGCKTREECDA